MASPRFDLHVHSTMSDGMLAPREVVALAADRGLAGVALTDHDTVAGLAEAESAALLLGVRLVRGIELSCTAPDGRQVHVLGYGIDPTSPELGAFIEQLAASRHQRARRIIELLTELDAPVTLDDVLRESGGRPPGRPHVARAMVGAGVIADANDAFSADWIGAGGRASVVHEGAPVADAIDVIHRAGGVAVLAHPGRSRGGIRDAEVRELASLGLDGIEVDHPDHPDEALRTGALLAVELGLLQTGGSDDHGTGIDGPRLGCCTVPQRVIDALEARAAQYRLA